MRVSGFVAIIAGQPDGTVHESDLGRLADAYAAVRGGTPGERVDAGRRARACAFGGPGRPSAPIERRGSSWALSAGVPRHGGTLAEARLDDLEGQFALLRHDATRGTVTLVSDPFGMFGLFVAERGGLTYVSTSAMALARHLGAPPSRLGLHTYLLAGYHCGTMTNWDGVERVGAGAAVEFGPSGRHGSTYWRPEVDPGTRRLGIAASVDRCLESAVEAVRSAGAVGTPVWCDLTGGYDTRILALLARSAGVSFVTSTNGSGDEEDTRLARRIAQAAGWEWSLLSLPEPWGRTLPDSLPEAVGWGDAALDAPQLAGVLWRHRAKAERSRHVLNGGGGEHYWSYAWQHEYGRSGRSGPTDLDTWVRIRMLRAVPTTVFAGDPRPEVVADLRARMEPVVAPYAGEPRAVQADLLYMHKCTGHFGAYAAAAAGHVDVHLPFYTRASFTAAFSTNPRHRFGHRFYRRLIDRLDPTIAAIPTAKGGPAQPRRLGNLHAFAPYYVRLGEKGLNKAAQRLLGRSFRRPPTLGDDAAAAARAAAVDHVGTDVGEWHTRALYDRAALDGLLGAAGRHDFGDSVLLGRILTAELGLRAAGRGLD